MGWEDLIEWLLELWGNLPKSSVSFSSTEDFKLLKYRDLFLFAFLEPSTIDAKHMSGIP